MTQEARVPASFLEQFRRIAQEAAAAANRAAPLRSATISEGGLTVRGGFLRLVFGAFNLFYVGPISPSAPDGTPQQGFRIRRADGTIALQTRDAFPGSDGTFNQALSWLDRGSNVVFADDTDSGQGIARPYVPGVFYESRSGDFPSTTAGSFETIFRAIIRKQQPRLAVSVWGSSDTAGATGEIRVMVNGTQLGSTVATDNVSVKRFVIGPDTVDGAHLAELWVEIQARVATGGGAVKVGAAYLDGRQS